MASSKAAIIRGIFLKPGLSKNKRLYTRENIGKAVERMNSALIGENGLPLTMATSHNKAYEDDALATVGHITRVVQLEDGSAAFEADIANTTQGRDIANLANGKFIKAVSIRGKWMGDVYTTEHDGVEAITADDLSIAGIDFTGNPGIAGAEITQVELVESAALDPDSIYESVAIDEIEVFRRSEEVVTETIVDEDSMPENSDYALDQSAPCPACGFSKTNLVAKDDTCIKCGQSLKPDSDHCPHCGAPVPQAESADSVLTQEEVTMSDATIETPAEESGPEAPTRTLSNADLEAFAAIIAAAIKPVESAPVAVETPAAESAPVVEPVVEPVAVEAAPTTNEETEVSQTFTLEQVQQIAAEAAKEAAKAAVESVKADAVESYRAGDGGRKGLVTESGVDFSALEHEEDDPRALAEMSQQEFRLLAKERWSSTPFFANMFRRADLGL